jgi:hypothetical protein
MPLTAGRVGTDASGVKARTLSANDYTRAGIPGETGANDPSVVAMAASLLER